ncbi:hypothetical protein [Streptomyces sp. NPDC089799]|uniref:hypothetical protein n=1 Tax=Streptomyces sp. NPDC089799 TaxID=3155066 RepID=UPI00342E0D72
MTAIPFTPLADAAPPGPLWLHLLLLSYALGVLVHSLTRGHPARGRRGRPGTGRTEPK